MTQPVSSSSRPGNCFANDKLTLNGDYKLPIPTHLTLVKLNRSLSGTGYFALEVKPLGQGYYIATFRNASYDEFSVYMSEIDRTNTEICVTY